jgi:hypothetical protein
MHVLAPASRREARGERQAEPLWTSRVAPSSLSIFYEFKQIVS